VEMSSAKDQQLKEAAEKSARSVFVGNIPYEATDEQLKDIFNQAGPVLSFRLVYDRETGKPKGYGFCEYKDTDTAQSAMRNLNGTEIHGRQLRVDSAASQKGPDDPRAVEKEISPYGESVNPDKAPETITNAVASLPPEQMFELMKQMKLCIQNNPEEARHMLLQNPQLAYALLQAQVIMKIVDPKVADAILHQPRGEPLPINTLMEKAGIGHDQKPHGSGPPPEWRGDRPPPHELPRDMYRDDMGRGGPPPGDFNRGRPPMREMRGPPPERDFRPPPMDDRFREGGPPFDPRDRQPPGAGDRLPIDPRAGPPPNSMDRDPRMRDEMRGPPRDDRVPPRDDRGPPREDRGPPRDDRRGPPPSRDPRDPRGGPPNKHDSTRGGPPPPGREGPNHFADQRPGGPPPPGTTPSGPPGALPPGVGSLAAGAGGPGGPNEEEKQRLIMQVLNLTDSQINMLPEDQRESIRLLKAQYTSGRS